jgi:hypothetical protein
VLEAVKYLGNALQYAHHSLQQDVEVVLSAVRQNTHAVQYAHSSLLCDKAFCLLALAQNDPNDMRPASDPRKFYRDGILRFMHESLHSDADVVRAALRKQASEFKVCKLKHESMAAYACSFHGCKALHHVPPELRTLCIIKAAVHHDAPDITLLPTWLPQLADNVQHNEVELAKHYVTACLAKHVPAEVVVSNAKACSSRMFCARILHQLHIIYHT